MPKKVVEEDTVPKSRMGQLFSTKRQILVFCFFLVYIICDICLLGLISEQLTKYGSNSYNYPDFQWYHALGLGLFASIFYLLFGLFHWSFGHRIFAFMFFSGAVFFATVAGLLYRTPFGHGLKCGMPLIKIDTKFQPWFQECSRITAISAFAWTMFGLSLLGLFWTIQDKFSCVSKREGVYAPYVKPTTEKDAEAGEAAPVAAAAH